MVGVGCEYSLYSSSFSPLLDESRLLDRLKTFGFLVSVIHFKMQFVSLPLAGDMEPGFVGLQSML